VQFWKYHALGNDYIVLEARNSARELSAQHIRRICDRHYGIGSDGILLDTSLAQHIALRILNPDGSEAEKSGNGLRIFARWLWDQRRVVDAPFTIDTRGGSVRAQVLENGALARIEMGRVSVASAQTMTVAGREIIYRAADIGNPHCVVLCDACGLVPTAELARELGALIEHDARFTNRTNVQLMHVVDRARIAIEIWERGAGYTFASGSSSCASAAVAHAQGWCDAEVSVHQRGGVLQVSLSPQLDARLTGAVTAVAHGELSDELLTWAA
jgi:diaminopimelate epimerase